MLAAGESWASIGETLGCSPDYIQRWKKRFERDRLAGLFTRHRGRAVETRTPKLEAKILDWTRRPPPDGSTHWSCRKLADHLGTSHMMVARVWSHGTLSLYAALNTKSGEVLGKTAVRHTTEEFVAFLGDIVASQAAGREIHVIVDNPSTHKTQRVRDFLNCRPNVHIHFTPTYSSWLNQVERWFAKIERDVIARRIFTSVPDLARKIRRYIRHHNRSGKPIKWAYRDPSHRILPTTDSAATVQLSTTRTRTSECQRH
jgi:hypothetical protein